MSGFMAEQATGATYGFTDQGVTAALTWRFHIRGTGSNATGRAVRRRPLRRPRRPVAMPSSPGRTVTINLAGLVSTSV